MGAGALGPGRRRPLVVPREHHTEAPCYERLMTVVAPVKRVGMISLGCPKNLVDAEIMLGQLQADAGHVELTNDLDEADVVIVNTCGFIDAAKQESIDTILEIAGKKGRGVER